MDPVSVATLVGCIAVLVAVYLLEHYRLDVRMYPRRGTVSGSASAKLADAETKIKKLKDAIVDKKELAAEVHADLDQLHTSL
jgi:hypothetical protein